MPTYTYRWQEHLHEALLEVDGSKLREKVELADNVVRSRIHELSLNTESSGEKIALRDALSTLRVLKRLSESSIRAPGTDRAAD